MSHHQDVPCFVELKKLEIMEEVLTSNDSVVEENADPVDVYRFGPPDDVDITEPPKPRSMKVSSKYKVCPICTRRFPNRPTLHDHMQYHEYLSYQCSHCPSMFATFRGMARHRGHCSSHHALLSSSQPLSSTVDTSSRVVPLTEDKAVQVHFKLKFKRRSASPTEPNETYRKLRSTRQHTQSFATNGIYTIVNNSRDEVDHAVDPNLEEQHQFVEEVCAAPTARKRKSPAKEKILKRDLPGLKYFDLMANVEKLKLLYFMQNENGRFCCPMCGKESSKSVGALNHIRMHPDLAPILEYYTACSEGSCLTNWDPLPHLQVPEPKMKYQGLQESVGNDTPPQAHLSPLRKRRRSSSLRKTRRVRRPNKWRNVLGGVTKNNPHECVICQQIFHRPFGIAAHYSRCHQLDMQSLVDSHIFDTIQKVCNHVEQPFADRVDEQQQQEDSEMSQMKREELEELEGNLNTVLGCMVKDEEVLQELGWPVRDVELLLTDILSQCGEDQCLDRGNDGASNRLERLRGSVAVLLKVCIKDAAMITYGWDKKPVDEVLKEMLMASEIAQLVK